MNYKSLLIIITGCFLCSCQPSASELYEQANKYFAQDNFEQAIPIYEKLLLRDSNNVFKSSIKAEENTLIV